MDSGGSGVNQLTGTVPTENGSFSAFAWIEINRLRLFPQSFGCCLHLLSRIWGEINGLELFGQNFCCCLLDLAELGWESIVEWNYLHRTCVVV